MEGSQQGGPRQARPVPSGLPRTRRTRLWLEEADLEIDTEARVLRRLIVHRNRQGLPFAKLTFTLVETRPAHDDGYRLESRLTQPMHIFERPLGPAIRRELFARWMGPQASVRPSNRPAPKPTGRSDKLPESDRELRIKAIDGKTYTPLATPNKKASLLLFVLPDCLSSHRHKVCCNLTRIHQNAPRR